MPQAIAERAQAMGIHPAQGGIPTESPEEITRYIEISKRMSPMALMR